MTLTPTQQELNVRFAKALGWKEITHTHIVFENSITGECLVEGDYLPNYFSPENFHLVRAAVGELDRNEQQVFFYTFHTDYISKTNIVIGSVDAMNLFLFPAEHIITAYLKVKENN